MALPFKVRPGHQWLAPFFNVFNKVMDVAAPSGYSGMQGTWAGRHVPIAQLGNSTGVVGLYGFTGIAKTASYGVATGGTSLHGSSGLASTGIGNSGLYLHMVGFAVNGGSGTYVTLGDVVAQLKNMGIISQ